jgi:urease accessory protein
VIAIKPNNMFEMASICYEIGNKHLPLFYENDELLVPFELPLFRLLEAQGYDVKQDKRKLLQPLKTTVSPHAHPGGETLFSKIMKLTASPNPSEGGA